MYTRDVSSGILWGSKVKIFLLIFDSASLYKTTYPWRGPGYLYLYQLLAVRNGTGKMGSSLDRVSRVGSTCKLLLSLCFQLCLHQFKKKILDLIQLQGMSTCEDVMGGSDAACNNVKSAK